MNGDLVHLARFFRAPARELGSGLLLRVTRPIWGSSLKILRQNLLFDPVMSTVRLGPEPFVVDQRPRRRVISVGPTTFLRLSRNPTCQSDRRSRERNHPAFHRYSVIHWVPPDSAIAPQYRREARMRLFSTRQNEVERL